MTGPYPAHAELMPIAGVPILYETPSMGPAPAASTKKSIGGIFGKGWVAPYLKCIAPGHPGGWLPGDIIQQVPWWSMVAGASGGSLESRVRGPLFEVGVSQEVYLIRRETSNWDGVAGDPEFSMTARGIFPAGPGPFSNNAGRLAPAGPILVGETPEAQLMAATTGIRIKNPTEIEPFMWTIYGRCLVAEGGCQPGDIMALGCNKVSGVVRGWNISYYPPGSYFILNNYSSHPLVVGKDGNFFAPTPANWSIFFRFIGTPKGGLRGNRLHKRTAAPIRMWMSPPQQFGAGLTPLSIALPDGFNVALCNSIYINKIPQMGCQPGDWMPAQGGDSGGGNNSGFSAIFERGGRRVLLRPNITGTQHVHPIGVNSFSVMTAANWSWAYIFVG